MVRYERIVEASTRWLPRTVITVATTAAAWSAVTTARTPTDGGDRSGDEQREHRLAGKNQ